MPGSNLRSGLEAIMREAGELARMTSRGDFKRWTKGHDNSPVSDADIAVNNLLKERLAALAPAAGWLSEETEDSLPGRAMTTAWIVDPIDGTRAFISGRPDWTISVALVEHDRPVLAALYAPVTEEMFLGVRGQGTTLNGAASILKAAANRARVYSDCGALKISTAAPASTILPLRITIRSLASARTTFKSWLINR